MLVAFDFLNKLNNNPLLGFLVIAVFVGIPLWLSVLTWTWLGGKEKP